MLKTKLLISTLVEYHFSGPESQEAISLLRKLTEPRRFTKGRTKGHRRPLYRKERKEAEVILDFVETILNPTVPRRIRLFLSLQLEARYGN